MFVLYILFVIALYFVVPCDILISINVIICPFFNHEIQIKLILTNTILITFFFSINNIESAVQNPVCPWNTDENLDVLVYINVAAGWLNAIEAI